MTTIRLYLFRQFLRSTGAVCLILFAIGVVDVIFRLVRHDVDPVTVLHLAVIYMLNALTGSILPIGMYFGLFVVIGKLCQSQELYSAYSNGIPRAEIRRVLFILIAPVLLFNVVVNFYIYPNLKFRIVQLQLSSSHERINAILERGSIFSDGALTAMHLPPAQAPPSSPTSPVSSVDGIEGMQTEDDHPPLLLIYRLDDSYMVQIAEQLPAETASPENLESYDFNNGMVYMRDDKQDVTAHFQYRNSNFSAFRQIGQSRELSYKEKDVFQLMDSRRRNDRVELQRRILTPILFLICFIFAIYCAEILPRQSSYSRLPQAMILLVAAFLVVRFGPRAVQSGVIPLMPGMWAFLPIIIFLALFLYRVRR